MATKKQSAAKAAADKKLGEILAAGPPPLAKMPEPTPGSPTPGHPPANMQGLPTQVQYPEMDAVRPLPLDEGESSLVQQLNDMAADAERLGRAILMKTFVNKYKGTFDRAATAAILRIRAALSNVG